MKYYVKYNFWNTLHKLVIVEDTLFVIILLILSKTMLFLLDMKTLNYQLKDMY